MNFLVDSVSGVEGGGSSIVAISAIVGIDTMISVSAVGTGMGFLARKQA